MAVLGKQTLWEGRFLRAVRIEYRVRCGPANCVETRSWEAFERVNCDGVIGIVPITDAGEVLLIRQFRPPVSGKVVELPAGLVDAGESFEAAARRELVEETGYEANEMRFLMEGPMSSGASAEVLTVFVATGLRHVGIGRRDETEDIEVLAVQLADVPMRLKELHAGGDHIDLKLYGMIAAAEDFLGLRRR